MGLVRAFLIISFISFSFGFDCDEWISSCSHSNITGSVLQCVAYVDSLSLEQRRCSHQLYDRVIDELLEKERVDAAFFVAQLLFKQVHPALLDMDRFQAVRRLLDNHYNNFDPHNESAVEEFNTMSLWKLLEPSVKLEHLQRDDDDVDDDNVVDDNTHVEEVALLAASEWHLEAVLAPTFTFSHPQRRRRITCLVPNIRDSPNMYANTFRVAAYPEGLTASLPHLADFVLRMLKHLPTFHRIFPTDDMSVLTLSELYSRPNLDANVRKILAASLPLSSATFPPKMLSKIDWALEAQHVASSLVRIPNFQVVDSPPKDEQSCQDISRAFQALTLGPLMMKSEYSFGSAFVRKVPSADEACKVAVEMNEGMSRSYAHAGHPKLHTRILFQQIINKQSMHVVAVQADKGSLVRGWTARIPHEFRGQGAVFQTERNGALENFVDKFIARVNYTGFCAFDFIQDFSGTFWMIDLNPRLIAMSCFNVRITNSAGVNICESFQRPKDFSPWRMNDGVLFVNPLREPLRDCASKYNAGWYWNWVWDEPALTDWVFHLNECEKQRQAAEQ